MRPISDEDAIDLKRTQAETFEIAARCEDCGHTQTLPREGGLLEDCCDLGELRRFSLRASDGIWRTHPNPIRDTVDGPPQLLWLQSTTDYGLYVNGKLVDEISGPVLDRELGVKLINRLLTKAFES